ncbi:FolC bifunctional protein [Xylariaceae sp. FL0662B]|nr:FolC bifunctional protein [Xylariaceae sp. FL0662B]
MIKLELSRITALLKQTPQTWKAIHVAGTNGKGSICAYLTAMLCANRISCGRFTSPHLVDRWDCIAVNGRAVPENKFLHFEAMVKKRNEDGNLGATEFELLTATAFEIFEAEKVDVGVIEVGLGGRLDATNALKWKSVTVISKIGLDHQSFLGNTIEEIALQKAGIMRKDVPCVVDASNPKPVLDALQKHSDQVRSLVESADSESDELVAKLGDKLEMHQRQNLACAHKTFQLAYPQHANAIDILLSAAGSMVWPGRLQSLNISRLTGRKENVLLDGAHNPQSAEALSNFVQRHLRTSGKPVTWVLAASQGKDLTEILKLLLHPNDPVTAVEFGPVDGMPWVKPMSSTAILDTATHCGCVSSSQYDARTNVGSALAWASRTADEGPLVIAGSLYLVSDIAMSRHKTPAHLVIVCCHGIWLGGPARGLDESEWLIASFQAGETPTFVEHVKAGLRVLKSSGDAVLMFSGGPTRKETRLSEARSYANLASANAYFGIESEEDEVSRRVYCEERALDSYSNVLSSLIRFWHEFRIWPQNITIVSHAFKRERLVDCHCGAIGFPLHRVDFVGVDPPGMVDGTNEAAVKGVLDAVKQWKEDPHGKGEVLAGKRHKRNPWGISQKLFLYEDDRARSGVRTSFHEGGQDYLAEGFPQPWSEPLWN